MGHYCRICGRTRANEKFSGKGHRNHICKDCSRRKAKKNSKHEEHFSPELLSLAETMPTRLRDVFGNDFEIFDLDFERYDADEEDDENLPF
ncbi:hypothetical protein SAMN02982927_02803 [Sporolactobacillus nakayamae]|uniref:Uncharacterized protein n=1 Tax=Sporolactobacillus nakayamae TaxID=269670 RepID=A0A1I2URH5_9BACL|nr:hypothetical protein SAMN02982927_02803 [Sporolactobacillus nakayamae]